MTSNVIHFTQDALLACFVTPMLGFRKTSQCKKIIIIIIIITRQLVGLSWGLKLEFFTGVYCLAAVFLVVAQNVSRPNLARDTKRGPVQQQRSTRTQYVPPDGRCAVTYLASAAILSFVHHHPLPSRAAVEVPLLSPQKKITGGALQLRSRPILLGVVSTCSSLL